MKAKRLSVLLALLLAACCLLSACTPKSTPPTDPPSQDTSAPQETAPPEEDYSGLRAALLLVTESPVDEALLDRFGARPNWFQSVLDSEDALCGLITRYQNPISKEILDFDPLGGFLCAYRRAPEGQQIPDYLLEEPAISEEERQEKLLEAYRFLVQDFALGEGRVTRSEAGDGNFTYEIEEFLEDGAKSGTVCRFTCLPSGTVTALSLVKSGQAPKGAVDELRARALADKAIAEYWVEREIAPGTAPTITEPGTVRFINGTCRWEFTADFPCPCEECSAAREDPTFVESEASTRTIVANIDAHTGECVSVWRCV